jgi:hypothetical protein
MLSEYDQAKTRYDDVVAEVPAIGRWGVNQPPNYYVEEALAEFGFEPSTDEPLDHLPISAVILLNRRDPARGRTA